MGMIVGVASRGHDARLHRHTFSSTANLTASGSMREIVMRSCRLDHSSSLQHMLLLLLGCGGFPTRLDLVIVSILFEHNPVTPNLKHE
jgi:hypothetical protein